MKIELGETIEIFPKILLFNKFPSLIDDEMLINFLKLDILLLENKKNNITCSENIIAEIINTDEYIFDDNDPVKIENECKQIINENLHDYCINHFVISSNKNPLLKDSFLKLNTPYFFRKNLSKDELINIIKEIINSLREKKEMRSSLRIIFKPGIYKASIYNSDIKCDCFIKDMSIGGLSLQLVNEEQLKKINVGSFFSISVDLYMTCLEILRAVVVKKDNSKNLVSIRFNFTDKYEIDEENTQILESVITTWIKKIVKSHALLTH